jgi:hypothetical protein
VTTAGNVGGYDQAFSLTPTVTASSYTAGYAIGGLQTFPVFRTTTLPGGELDGFSLTSLSGITAIITVYVFSSLPAGTGGNACTDHAAFTVANADVPKLILSFQVQPVVQTGMSASIATQFLALSVANKDSVATQNLYVCLVATGTPTPGSTSDITDKLFISQD